MSKERIARWETAAVLILLSAFMAQAILSANRKSLVIDEYTHFGAGAAYVWENDYRLNSNHPPFSKIVTGLALLPLHPVVPGLPSTDVRRAQKVYGSLFICENQRILGRLVLVGRTPHILIAAFLGLALWWVCRGLFGRIPALTAVLLWAGDPNLLAHARLVHTDSDVTVFTFLTFAAFLGILFGRASRPLSFLFAVSFGLALLTKFSAVFLVVFLPFLLLLWWFGASRGWLGEESRRDVPTVVRRKVFRVLLATLIVVPVLAFLFILAARAVRGVLSKVHRRSLRGAFLAILSIGQGSVALRANPDYIPYFNELIGGANNGWRYLADSNVDWGQELISLRAWMERHDVREVVIEALGAGTPEIYGIRTVSPHRTSPSPDGPVYLALGATARARIVFGDGEESRAFLAGMEPVAVLGHSLYVYRVTRPFPRSLLSDAASRRTTDPDRP